MSGCIAAPLPIHRSAIAFLLCLLTFLFAFEAKLAWYSPERGLYGQVSTTKAFPVDQPTLVAHGAPAPDQTHAQAFFAPAILIAICMMTGDASPSWRNFTDRPSVFLPYYLLPPIDMRPPPAR